MDFFLQKEETNFSADEYKELRMLIFLFVSTVSIKIKIFPYLRFMEKWVCAMRGSSL